MSAENQMTEAKKSVLYELHVQLGGRMVEFGGYLMPVWYSSIAEEHRCVREAAGLFDCTHMGVLGVSGSEAKGFLELVATNEVGRLEIGRAQYSFILDVAGAVLDDIIVYRLKDEVFMVVVNASNCEKIKGHLEAVHSGRAVIDTNEPQRRNTLKPKIVDLREASSGPTGKVDLAIQGPASQAVIETLIEEAGTKEELRELKGFRFLETRIDGREVLISRTGYTGAKGGYEMFVAPDEAGWLWQRLLEVGERNGLQPCGLGARDSLRIEAGFPLYGHELAGEFEVSPYEAGYNWAVKPEKGFYIGKAALEKANQESTMTIGRLQLPGEKGVRPIRANDAVVDIAGRCVGWVTSCAKISQNQIALVYMKKDAIKEDAQVGIYYAARNKRHQEQGRLGQIKLGETVQADIEGDSMKRFERY
ncbi:MAG: glycine cleavage system aminomethyltransferase GcvT [Planctomycetes bacterium]|nr:glycine cleavage system aminomethyltransferase GcvT [Planctomycetota bacterium]